MANARNGEVNVKFNEINLGFRKHGVT